MGGNSSRLSDAYQLDVTTRQWAGAEAVRVDRDGDRGDDGEQHGALVWER